MSNTSQNTENPELSEATYTMTSFIKFLRDFVIVFLLAFAMRSFLMTPFQIKGESMENSYFNQEFILVNTF